MVSIAAEINSQRRRRPVVVYSPGRTYSPVAPTRRTTPSRRATQQRGPARWSEIEQAFAQTKGAQEKAQRQAQQQAEDEAWGDTPWYRKGLGMVLGNPIVSNALKPLGVIGTGGRAMTYGLEEAAEGLEGAPDLIQGLVHMVPGLGGAVNQVDTRRTEADDRSFYEKVISPTSDYGFGQLLNPENPGWYNKTLGLAGDIALDPTTYVSGGATRVANAASRSARLGEAASAANKIDEGIELAARAAEAGDFAEVARLSKAAAEQEALARRLTTEAGELSGGRVPLRQGRKAREQFLGEIAEENPDLFRRFGPELTKGAERGFNTIRDPALREAIGLGDPALRFMGANIPKTERLIYGTARAGGAARAAANRTPLLGSTMARFAPKGLEDSSGVLSRGKGGDVLKAATTTRIHNLMRRGAGSMEGRGNKALTDLARAWKGKTDDEIRTLFRAAEADAAPNDFNKFFAKLKDTYEQVAGRPMNVTRNTDTYVPHMMTPQFKRYLKARSKDITVAQYMKEAGFAEDDLLEGSHFLEKSRKLEPETIGVPKDFDLGGKTITLTDGTIDELNEQLGSVFSDFKGKAYMDDPMKIGEAYVSSISRQAGRDFALDRMAASRNPLVQEIAGPIAEAVEARNAYNRQNPVVSMIKKGYTAGQRAIPASAKGDAPTSDFDDMFASTLHVAETQAQRDTIMKEGKAYVRALDKDVSATRTTLVDQLKELRSTLMKNLTKRERAAGNEIHRINLMLDGLSAEVKALGPLSSENVTELTAVHHTVTQKLTETRGEIKKIQNRYGKKVPRDQARIQRELEKTQRRLQSELDKIEAQYHKGSNAMQAEAAERTKELNAPVEAAKKELEQAEAELPTPAVSKQRVQEANAFIRTQFDTEDAFEAERATYGQALQYMKDNNIPIRRKIDGRMTPETADEVEKIAQQIQAETPPPAAVPEPPAAVVPEAPAAPPAAPAAPSSSQAILLRAEKRRLNNLYKDAIADADDEAEAALEQQLDEIEERIKAAEAGTPAPEPAPVVEPVVEAEEELASGQLVRQPNGNYATENGFEAIKSGNQWRVMLDQEEDFGLHPTLEEARREIDHQQQMLGYERGFYDDEPAAAVEEAAEFKPVTITNRNRQSGSTSTYNVNDGPNYYQVSKNSNGRWQVKHIDSRRPDPAEYRSLKQVEDAINAGTHRPAAAVPEPEAAAIPEPEAAAVVEPEPVPEAPKKAPTQRITRKWTTKEDLGREVEVGPEGWQIETYDESIMAQRGPSEVYLTGGVEGPRVPLPAKSFSLDAQGARRPRFIAFNQNDDALRGRSFASAREAKLAVEDTLRRRRHKVTVEEYVARGISPEPQVAATFEELGSQLPVRPVDISPEEAAANLEAARAAPTVERPTPAADYTPEGAAQQQAASQFGLYQKPVTRYGTDTAGTPAYRAAHQEWQDALLRSSDPSLTDAQRNKAAREARSLGGKFVSKTGEFYSEYSARKILAEDVSWQTMRNQDDAVIAAEAKLAQAEDQAMKQSEAMVYVKQNNPITGQDEYTRVPDTSIGFRAGEERVPVLPKTPTQGEVPMGTLQPPPERIRESGYGEGTRARDRAILDDPTVTDWMMPDNRDEYLNLIKRSDDITDRIEVADANQAQLDELEEAGKAAYTAEVRAADDAVKEARKREDTLRREIQRGTPGASAAYENAKRLTQEAVDNQTNVRQAWMEADRAWKAKLAERDEFIQIKAAATNAEQALYNKGLNGEAVVRSVQEGRPLPQFGGYEPSREVKKLAREYRLALAKLHAAEDDAMEFLTDTERRALVGEMVGIDAAKRELRHQLNQDVQLAKDVLPQRQYSEQVLSRPDADLARFGDEAKPVKIPPVRGSGQEDLEARAYAESLEPTMPKVEHRWGINEGGVLQSTPRISGRQPYTPRTEREAIADLEKQAGAIEETPAGEALKTQAANVKEEIKAETDAAERMKEEAVRVGTTERDEALTPLRNNLNVYVKVDAAVNEKARLVPLRAEAQAQRKTIVAAKPTGKKADLVKVIDDLETVAKQNPKMLDRDLAIVEGELQAGRDVATQLAEKDMTRGQVQGVIDQVGRKDDNSLDIMLTTTSRGWDMIYEASGTKKAVLQEGDLIVEAELGKAMRNLYDMSKDKVLFGRTLNAFTNLFKTYATLTPGFHVRNALSAIFMNSSDGVSLATQLSAARTWKQYMDAEDGEKWLLKQPQQIQDAFAATYGSGAGGRFTEAGFAEVGEGGAILDRLERLQRNRFTRWSQRTGQRVEGSVRLAMAMDSMRLGEDIESAIQRINRIHFDYSEISTMDENVKRLIPFWTFMSRNMPMQVSQMWTKPRVYQQYQDFVRNMSATDEEYTPEYWTKAGAFNTGLKVPGIPGLGGAQGLPIYLSPDLGFTRLESDLKDYEDFLSGKRPGGVLSQVNPILSAPIEYFSRKDIFTGQTFEEGETVPAGGPLGWPIKLLAMAAGQEEGGEVDAAFANTIRALNPLQDRSSRLFPQLSGGDEEGRKRQLESWMRTMLGAPVRTLTPKQQDNEYYRRYYDEMDAMKQDQKRLQRQAG